MSKLNPYQVQVFLAVVDGAGTKEEINRATGLLPRVVGDALNKLVGNGRLKNTGGGRGYTAIYQTGKYYRIITGTCPECGEDFRRPIFYLLTKNKDPETCGKQGCAISLRNRRAAESGRDKNRGRHTEKTREEIRAGLDHIQAGDLAHMNAYKARVDRSECNRPEPFATNQCASYGHCLERNFIHCTGYKAPRAESAYSRSFGAINPTQYIPIG